MSFFRKFKNILSFDKNKNLEIEDICHKKWPFRSFDWPKGYIRPALEIIFSKIIKDHGFIFEKENILKNNKLTMSFSYDRGMVHCELLKAGAGNSPIDLRHYLFSKRNGNLTPDTFDIPGLPEGNWGTEFQQLERLAYVLEFICPEVLLGNL